MLMGQLVGIPLIFVIDTLIKKSGTRHKGDAIGDCVTAVSIFLVSVMLLCVFCIMLFNGKLKRRDVEDQDSFLDGEDVEDKSPSLTPARSDLSTLTPNAESPESPGWDQPSASVS